MRIFDLAASEAARFVRFAFVGGIGFLIDAGLLALLHYGAGLDPFSSRLISISVSAFTTWRLNRSLTFGASDRSQAKEGFRYAIVAGGTAGFNYLVYTRASPRLPRIAADRCRDLRHDRRDVLLLRRLFALRLSRRADDGSAPQLAEAIAAAPPRHVEVKMHAHARRPSLAREPW